MSGSEAVVHLAPDDVAKPEQECLGDINHHHGARKRVSNGVGTA